MPRLIAPAARLAFVAALLAALVLADARAARAAYTYNDALAAGEPTFDRPLVNADGTITSLSNIGTAVYFSALGFAVDAGGPYSFLSTASFDNYTFLYQGDFDPTAPLANALTGDDDDGAIDLSGFTADLTAGTRYVFVTTSFYNGATGPFADVIDGPGAITPSVVPAPPSIALLACALPGALVARQIGRRARLDR